MPITSSTSSSSTPSMTVALDCLRNPPEDVEPGRPELALEQGVDEGAGVFVVHDGHDELHARRIAHRRAVRIAGRAWRRTRRDRRCTMPTRPRLGCAERAPADLDAAGARASSTRRDSCPTPPAPASGPARRALGRRGRARTRHRPRHRAGGDRRGRRGRRRGLAWPRSSGRTRSAASLELLVTLGMDEAAIATLRGRASPATRSTRSTAPRSTAPARSAAGACAPDGRRDDRSRTCRSWWPGGDGIEARRGRAVVRLAGESHDVSTAEETLLVGTSRTSWRRRSAPSGPPRWLSERAEWLERIAHTDPLTGLANCADADARAGARGRPGPAAGQRGVRGRASTSTAYRAQRRRRAPAPATRSCARWRRSSRRASGSWTRSRAPAADEFVLVAPGLRGRDRRAAGPGRHRRARDGRGSRRDRQRRRRPLPAGRRWTPRRCWRRRGRARRAASEPGRDRRGGAVAPVLRHAAASLGSAGPHRSAP